MVNSKLFGNYILNVLVSFSSMFQLNLRSQLLTVNCNCLVILKLDGNCSRKSIIISFSLHCFMKKIK